jgi:hypothetical protein
MKDLKITFDEFAKHINDAVAIMTLQDNLYSAVADYNDQHSSTECDFGYFPTLIDNVVDLLEKLTDDHDKWISYWMFDLDCGRDNSLHAEDEDGNIIPLKTVEDLWAVLNS